MEGARILVSGRVQMVGFRYFTVRQAEALGVKGYVRNLPGGGVEIEAEAAPEDLKKFIAAVSEGPSSARVEKADIQSRPVSGYTGFGIRY